MPGPTTEVLNEDVRELKGELRDIRNDLNVLKADVHRIDVGLAELRAEFKFAKWLIGILLAMTVSGIGAGIWQTATLTSEVKHLTTTLTTARPQAPPLTIPGPSTFAPTPALNSEPMLQPSATPLPEPAQKKQVPPLDRGAPPPAPPYPESSTSRSDPEVKFVPRDSTPKPGEIRIEPRRPDAPDAPAAPDAPKF
jgi:hypothetical protein